MRATVGREGAFALKVFPPHRSGSIASVVALTRELRFIGIPTPETSADFHAHGIRFPWIDGPTMKQRLEQAEPGRSLQDLPSMAGHLGAAMKILRELHGADISRHDLTNFKPFRHIDWRLGHSNLINQPPLFQSNAMELRAILKARMPELTGRSVIHGDFHVGQLIQDRTSKKWWLIDLDDVARGCPEADVANFCVHLATSRTIVSEGVRTAYPAIMAIAVDAYGKSLDSDLLKIFAALTFLRRALKKAEHGDASAWTTTLLAAGCDLVS